MILAKFFKKQKKKKRERPDTETCLVVKKADSTKIQNHRILAGHEHYDHTGDIPCILSMLIDESIQEHHQPIPTSSPYLL